MSLQEAVVVPNGATHPQPLGLIQDMPAETYHGIAAMSAGGLRRMAVTPRHFFGLQLDPNRPPQGEPTPAMKAGTLFHCALFEPDTVGLRYVAKPAGLDGRTKEVRAWAAEHAGREIVDQAQIDAAQRMAVNVRALPEIGELMAEGVGESSAFWIDEKTGEQCKCRPDWYSPAGDGVILLDGKSCKDASPNGFARSIWNWRYDLQAAWYSDGFEIATGKKVHGFVFCAVESDWPHAAAAYMLDDQVLDAARRENRRLLDQYAECKRTSVWPGYPETISLITLPAWAMKEIEA